MISLFPEITLSTLNHDGRKIAYSTSSRHNEKNLPAFLFFYPGGGNRRMIYSFRNLFSECFVVCVNRPGTGGTSHAKIRGASAHLATAANDALCILDEMKISKVSLLCMCAGTPFCLSFAAMHPERTTGNITAISSWIQPGDCGAENTKLSFYMGKTMRPLVSPIAGLVFASIGTSLASFPTSMTLSAFRTGLSAEERQVFDELYHDATHFGRMMKWMQEENGNNSGDVSVLLSANLIDYQKVSDTQQSITMWHGTKDKMVPLASAQWMASEECLSSATLRTIPDGTHQGCNFLLHSSIVNSLKMVEQAQVK